MPSPDNFKWPFPSEYPDAGTLFVIGINPQWIPILVSCCEVLNNPDTWDSPPSDFQGQIATLVDLIMTNLD